MNEAPPEFSRGNKWIVRALNSIVTYFRTRCIDPSGRSGWRQGPNGWVPPPTPEPEREIVPPFAIKKSEPDGVTIANGRIHIASEAGGLSADITPSINGTLLSASTPPVLNLSTGTTDIYIKFELEPVGQPIAGAESVTYIVGGYETVVNNEALIVTTKTTQEADVSSSTGTATQNLIASVYLGSVTKATVSGETTITPAAPQGRYGPISVTSCGAAISVQAPVFLILEYQPVAE